MDMTQYTRLLVYGQKYNAILEKSDVFVINLILIRFLPHAIEEDGLEKN